MVQQVGAAGIEGKGAEVIFAFRGEYESAAEVCVEVDQARHCAEVARNVSIDGVCGEQAELRAVDAGAGCGCVGWPVVEVAVTVVICPVVTLYGAPLRASNCVDSST